MGGFSPWMQADHRGLALCVPDDFQGCLKIQGGFITRDDYGIGRLLSRID